MAKEFKALAHEAAQVLREGGPEKVGELLFEAARSYSGVDPASFTVRLLASGVEAAAEQAVKAYVAGDFHLCEGQTLRLTGEAKCPLCTGDWTSAREERAAEAARAECVTRLRDLARSHRDQAASEEEYFTSEHEAAVAQELESAASSLAGRQRLRVPHCPSCGEALVEDGEPVAPGKEECVFCGSVIDIADDGSCRIIFGES